MPDELKDLLEEALNHVAQMTPEEYETTINTQCEGYSKPWPRVECTYINGVKVYARYEDYCYG